ncbi:MAG TPA: NAD(P)-dependent glycerol-1-phosphate dehydrogenase [Candidatus Methanomethylophilaceae archaeon]|nr:glycerol-phosphate dehydrogenase [Candidatus Methanomethylophilaceae archaeon]HIJ00454.1 NAD(P)-dependent glycerol-1-phosphate dehydrogenase [Candidatus Methanomethylophilaceae archaeon]
MTEDFFKRAKAMVFPRNVIVGHDVIEDVAKVCRDFDLSGTGLVVTGNETIKVAGRHVLDLMMEAGYEVQPHITGNATFKNLDLLLKHADEINVDFLLAVGGGSKIDLCKMAAKELKRPFISIPTSASHDGIASGRASMKGDLGPKSVDAVVPMAVIADSAIIVKSPYRLLASGCADVISNSTALMDWEFARRLRNIEFSRSAFALAQYSAETIIENAEYIRPNFEESVWIAIRPIIISGISMSVAGSSRPTSGAEHMFSHALDILYPNDSLHGEQCGVGSIMMMYLHGGDWQRIREALMLIGAPTCAKDLGLKPEQIIHALTEAHRIRKDRFTILGDNGLTREAAERVATITKVI